MANSTRVGHRPVGALHQAKVQITLTRPKRTQARPGTAACTAPCSRGYRELFPHDRFAGAMIVAALGLALLVATYFVTSCDSGTLVIATVLSDGAEEPPIWLRLTWGLAEGLLAAVLLVVGGLAALQTAVILAGLPVAMLLLVIVFGLMKGLRGETAAPRPGIKTRADCEPWTGCAC